MLKYKWKILIILAVMAGILFTGCNNSKSRFTGSKSSNDDHFLVDFEVLNKTVDGEIKLEAGDEVNVIIAIDKGSVDVSIKDASGDNVYQGKDAETSSFSVKAGKTGTYTCTVTGNNAKGSVHFIKAGTE